MIISKTGNNYSAPPDIAQTAQNSSTQTKNAYKERPVSNNSTGALNNPYNIRDNISTSVLQKLNDKNSASNKIAKNLRHVNDSMLTLEKQIDNLSEKALAIGKNYPPFPPGREDRVKFLKMVSAFKKQIDLLTIPPPPEESQNKSTSEQSVGTKPGILTIENDNNRFYLAIKTQNLRESLEGLGLNKLNHKSSDEKILTAFKDLDPARQMTKKIRASLENATTLYVQIVEHDKQPDDFESGNINADEALPESEKIGYELSLVPGKKGLTIVSSLLTGLLN